MDDRMSENIADIEDSHKVHDESHEKLEIGMNRRTNPDRNHLPKRLIVRTTICYSHDATKMIQKDYIFTKLQKKINHLMNMDNIKIVAKNKKKNKKPLKEL